MLKLEDLVMKSAAGKAKFMGREVAVSLVGEGVLADIREACPSPLPGPGEEAQAAYEADRRRMMVLTFAAAMDVAATIRRVLPTAGGGTRTDQVSVTAARASGMEDAVEVRSLMRGWCDAVWRKLGALPAKEWKGVNAEYARLEGLDLYSEAVGNSSAPSPAQPAVGAVAGAEQVADVGANPPKAE